MSIPHTGTRFLKERLGIEDHVHTNINWAALTTKIHNRKIIAPLRRPNTCWRSWCRRRDDGEVLRWAPHFFASWYIMHTLDQLYDIDYICVDKRDDPRIEDWKEVGNEDQDHAGWVLHKVDLRVLYKIPFVNRHYPSHLK